MTKWYGPIEVNGKRPAWLADKDWVRWWLPNDTGVGHVSMVRHINWGLPPDLSVKGISIPADHWAVAPLKAGYEPWAGGENEPDDWDGARLLFRNGSAGSTPSLFYWTHGLGGFDIIGYRKRKDAEEGQPGQAEKSSAATSREDVIREVLQILRGLGGGNYAIEIERHLLPMSDVERMAREMHAQSMAGITPWERLTDWTREGWLKTAKWAIEHGARFE